MRIDINKLYTLLFSLLFFSVPFIGNKFYAIPNAINIALGILFPWVFNREKFLKAVKNPVLIWFTIFLTFVTFRSIIFDKIIEDISVLRKLFQILPLIILSLGLKKEYFKYLDTGIVYGTLISVTYSLVNILISIRETGEFIFDKGPLINQTLTVQRLYLGLLCCISIIIVLDRFFKKYKKVNLVLAFIFSLFVFIIAARIAIVSTIIILIYYAFFRLQKTVSFFAILIIISSSIYVILNNNNISKRVLHIDDNYRTSYFEKMKTHEPRFLIWKYSHEIFKETNILIGNGFEQTEELLLNKYQGIVPAKKSDWFIQKRFNTHNQYLDILLSQGYIGLLIFMIFIFYLFKSSLFSHKLILLIITISLYMFIYNNFHRQIGIFIFSFILISILNNNHKKMKFL
tara:strand:- start:909 stop:2111 length:1203 start_codon:yes stop_codon:yes gene_type:complete